MARAASKLSRFNIAALALGFAFLYLPIVILIIYSFNASRLVTVWGGWSLRWYTEFFNDSAMIDAAWMSFRVAATSATIATLLGTLAAVALSRGEGFRGRILSQTRIGDRPAIIPAIEGRAIPARLRIGAPGVAGASRSDSASASACGPCRPWRAPASLIPIPRRRGASRRPGSASTPGPARRR